MGQFSMEKPPSTGSLLSGNQHGCAFPVLVALAEGRLLVGRFARIGVHQAWIWRGSRKVASMQWTEMLARQLREHGVVEEPIQAMLTCKPDDLIKFDADDLIRWGGIPYE
ncbi:hypothetical protein [Mesorhizobium sp. CN2-181]|uniref:hypothetical protein n=1 Tax=Mesorhizobium yinganensis TaxID=3157707 RepID=UPI0032B812E7